MNKRIIWLALPIALIFLAALGATFAQGQVAGAAMTPQPDLACNGGVHVVQPGETLKGIAARYHVSLWDLIACNRLRDPDLIRPRQMLQLPVWPQITRPPEATSAPPPETTSTPPPEATLTSLPPIATPTSPALPCPCEEIVIAAPGRGMTVTSPVLVSGFASAPFEQTVIVAVLDAGGAQIGLAPGTIAGEFGQRGPFSVTVPFTVPANSQPGRIQVYTESPRDGAIEHLSSVTVVLQGLELDPLLERLERAVNAKNYAALEALMGPQFQLGFFASEWGVLTAAEAIEQLRTSYLEPGSPYLDFSVDARRMLGDRATFPPEVIHVVFSPGWGPGRNDDAFLLIGDVAGSARWTGMLYIPHERINYR